MDVAGIGDLLQVIALVAHHLLGDQAGQEIAFGVIADSHTGSAHSQPTAIRRFLATAYHEYGVRHMFMPGDLSTGVNGYTSQDADLIPVLRGYRGNPSLVSFAQVDLMSAYHPAMPNLTYYMIGGNHDYWHCTKAQVDAVGLLRDRRPDMRFLGYDLADIPLTDRLDVHLFHPSGGGAASKVTRLEKALNERAFEDLERAVREETGPKACILLAGHYHMEVKYQRGNFIAAQCGCFEGRTNYEKQRTLTPVIGGAIFRVWVGDNGLLTRCEYTFFPYTEIHDDWANAHVPELPRQAAEVDRMGVIYSIPW